MTIANKARIEAFTEDRVSLKQHLFAPVSQSAKPLALEMSLEGDEVVANEAFGRRNLICALMRRNHGGLLMARSDNLPEFAHIPSIQEPTGQLSVEPELLIETPHLERILHGRAIDADPGFAVLKTDSDDRKVEIGR